ncbi:MAG: transporter permease [Chloroflexi bacterium]|jgi:sulfonate transport system permease protein|nr:transporter permease [Chloroflexota bacterium]
MIARPRLRRLAVPLSLVGLWQLTSSTGSLPDRKLTAPATVIATAWRLTANGVLPHNLVVSLGRAVLGLAIGATLGVTLGVLSGLSRAGEDMLDATVQMLRTLPFLGLVPLFILWFGIGETPKVAMVSLGVFFPLYLNTFSGIRGVDEGLVDAARSCGLGRLGLVRHVVLPGALPSVLVGLRYSLGLAWLSLVVVEQVNADSGLGYLMNNAREFIQTDVLVLALAVYALLGLATDAMVRFVERGALAWRRDAAFAGT